jgi:hypothetical protein
MSIIKDIYELAKDGAIKGAKIAAIKRALSTELKLNSKFLMDIFGYNEKVNYTS